MWYGVRGRDRDRFNHARSHSRGYERSGHKRARWPVFPHELQTISPLHSARVCQPVNSGYTACSGTTWPHALPAHTSNKCEAGPGMQCGPCALSPQGRGDIGLEFNSNSSSPGLDTHTFKEFRLLVAGHFPKTPQCPHNNLFRHVQREMEDCHPHRTVIRCDLHSLNSLQHMDASDAGSLRGKPYIKNNSYPGEVYAEARQPLQGPLNQQNAKLKKIVRGRPCSDIKSCNKWRAEAKHVCTPRKPTTHFRGRC
ncbi:hypothetical protein BSL78_07166 [Apostichopus japonicus]|uniref:Uncharacterized protein n=1 Tax=Stichopus japonicus TaxID=307972 RepID=A0A2G8L6R9_STIJA|nr:hypothetical protein BSL78_07166 [Apostichopus japonicus]